MQRRLPWHFLKQSFRSFKNIWPSISRAESPKSPFHVVWQSMDWCHWSWGSNHQSGCTSTLRWGRVWAQSSWPCFNWKGTFLRWFQGKLKWGMRCYSKSNSHRVLPGWCLWVQFLGRDRSYFFPAKWQTGPFGTVGSWIRWRIFWHLCTGPLECVGFSCQSTLV